jgi:hypothetical protein
MPKMTPGYAKNTIRRALRAVVDPEPTAMEIKELWAHFDSACAYCGRQLSKVDRGGHIDHLVSGGTNHISNRVLACPPCNGDEKRESNWKEFLELKCASDVGMFNQRSQKIQSWRKANERLPARIKESELEKEIEQAVGAFDSAVANLRRLRNLQ